MTDEQKSKDDAGAKKSPEEKAPAKKKGGIIKYVLFSVAGMVLVGIVAFVTLLLTGHSEQGPVSIETSDQVTQAKASDEHKASHEADSLGIGELDQNTIDIIMNNLAALDYEPDSSEIKGETGGMSAKDSIEAVNWLEKEKAGLAEKEKDLDDRRKELERLDTQVSKKILRIEQVESSRIAGLAKLYDGMDARAVAKLMANLDDKTVVSILPRMKIKNASAVLQLLPPQRAAKLSKQMITIAEK